MPANSKLASLVQVPYKKLLASLACSSRTEEYKALGRFFTDLAKLGPHYHDFKPILPPHSFIKTLIPNNN